MNFSKTNVFCTCVMGLVLIAPVHNAPKSRSKGHSSTKFDQTQSGDYNIQVHLKDFHIIAVLGDDPFGSYGDYDYNYDYSDLTIKPILPATTASPQVSTNSSEISTNSSEDSDVDLQKPETAAGSTEKPNDHPYPIVSPPTSHPPLENSASTTSQPQASTTSQPQASTNTPSSNSNVDTAEKEQPASTNSGKNVTATEKPTTQKSDTQPTEKPGNPEKPSTIHKVKMPQKTTKLENSGEIYEKKTESSVTNISIVPAETGIAQNDPRLPLGEIMHYRKCAEGYSRDKQGRCRKYRRTPQLPFGLSRFASNLATRFRQATAANSS